MTINHRRTVLVSSFLVVALSGALPGSPVSTVSAVEVIYSECEIEGGEAYCSFGCAPSLRIEAWLEGGESVEAKCGITVVAQCSGAPCTSAGTSFSTRLDGHCKKTGASGLAGCRAVVSAL